MSRELWFPQNAPSHACGAGVCMSDEQQSVVVEEPLNGLTLSRAELGVAEARESLGEGGVAGLAGRSKEGVGKFRHDSRAIATPS